MREPIPLVLPDGTVEDWPAGTRVRRAKPCRVGLGGKRGDGTTTLRSVPRQERGGERVVLPDGREARLEGWSEQVRRLEAALAEVTRERDALRAEVAPTWARAMVTDDP